MSNQTEQKKERYIGSVRFYKNLILLPFFLMIIIPTVLCFVFYNDLSQSETEREQLQSQLTDTTEKLNRYEGVTAGEGVSYQSLYADFYAPQPLDATAAVKNTIYLTFDDGPSVRTDEVLDILKEAGVKATFFVTGKTGEADIARLKRIVEEGHTIGMHTYTHNYRQIYASVEAFLEDMYQVFQLVKENTGVTPTVFRFPGGSINGYNQGIYQELLAEMLRRGFVPHDWNISSQDAAGYSMTAAQMTQLVLRDAEEVERGIVLMHDAGDKTTTVAALPEMIRGLKEQGFQFAGLSHDTKPVLFGYIA
ncbi:MAG: polysaccharide deacetylase [Ruminococcaceae bacterium]|nr:polysaccharide deacetylase [Oscillospiraceae bacterium]